MKNLDSFDSQVQELRKYHSRIKKYFDTAIEEESEYSEKNWENFYNLVFNQHFNRRISVLLDDINMHMDYYDPDTSYKEDVLAYYHAFDELMEDLYKTQD